jgi:hypothetical protein
MQFTDLLNDAAQNDRRAAAKDAIRKLVMAEPLPVLSRNLIDALRHHLDVMANYIERRYDIADDWT